MQGAREPHGRPGRRRRAAECLVGWPAGALTGAGAVLVGATVVGIPLAFRMLSAMPRVARLGRDGPGERTDDPRWEWRC